MFSHLSRLTDFEIFFFPLCHWVSWSVKYVDVNSKLFLRVSFDLHVTLIVQKCCFG